MIPSPASEHPSLYNIHPEPTAIESPYPNPTENASLNRHRGAMGQTTVSAPKQVTERMGKHLGREPAAMMSPYPNTTENASLNIHRGAIDQTTVITTQTPKQVMERMGKHLQNMGMHVTRKGSFLYRCLYRGSTSSKESSAVDEQPTEVSPTDDRADVVRFTVELTLLDGLKDTYSLDIRRLRGSLRRYKLIYDDVRDRARSCAELNDLLPESSAGKC